MFPERRNGYNAVHCKYPPHFRHVILHTRSLTNLFSLQLPTLNAIVKVTMELVGRFNALSLHRRRDLVRPLLGAFLAQGFFQQCLKRPFRMVETVVRELVKLICVTELFDETSRLEGS